VYTRRNELHTAQSASDVIVVEDCKIIMESSYSNESDRDEEQMSQNTNSNSASVIVSGPTGVTGPHVIKFGYKEFTVRWRVGCRNCNKRIQDKVNITSAFTK